MRFSPVVLSERRWREPKDLTPASAGTKSLLLAWDGIMNTHPPAPIRT